MEVKAGHSNFIPPQFLQQSNFANLGNQVDAVSAYNVPENQNQHHVYNSLRPKSSVHTESGLTCNIIPAPRKRYRDSMISQFQPTPNINNVDSHQFTSFLGEDILPQIQQNHLDQIDTIISQHTKRIRLELEKRQKQQQRVLGAAIREKVVNKLNEKDVQIQRMDKLNFVLQERVKTLYNENQLWRELAQTNQATVNTLRTNLERISAQSEEDAQSCCSGSEPQNTKSSCYSDRRCKRCGERESCVLLLPCRHLCLCNACGSGTVNLQACPVCNCSMNATLHVNMSS